MFNHKTLHSITNITLNHYFQSQNAVRMHEPYQYINIVLFTSVTKCFKINAYCYENCILKFHSNFTMKNWLRVYCDIDNVLIWGICAFYLTLCTFSLEINESSLCDTRCLIQDVVSPHCGDKRMARRCTRRSLPHSFVMTSYHWNPTKNTSM